MKCAYPLISDLLARISVLPATSADVERVFSTLKRMKTPIRNRLTTSTLDSVICISIDGLPIEDWNPTSALRQCEHKGNHKIIVTEVQSSV